MPKTSGENRINTRIKIYKLIDPNDQSVRYIGATRNSLKRRLNGHICDSRNFRSKNYKKCMWIHSLLKNGQLPTIEVIKEIDIEDWTKEETKAILEYGKQYNLYNISSGGDTGPSWKGKKHTEETKKKMSLKSKGHRRLVGCKRSEDFCKKLSINKKGNTNRVGLKNSDRHKAKLWKSTFKLPFEKYYEIINTMNNKEYKKIKELTVRFGLNKTTLYRIKNKGINYFKNAEHFIKENGE